jgi:phosphopantetheine--protein transferase-like protein
MVLKMTQGLYFADMTTMKKLAASPRFRSRFFSPQEMKFLMSKNFSPYVIGEMFCGKAAFVKALGPTTFRDCKMSEVSVLADYSGSYYLSLAGNAKKHLERAKLQAIVSCARNKSLIMANVIIEPIPINRITS